MYKKRQRGGNFKGKKYQRSKPKNKVVGGDLWILPKDWKVMVDTSKKI
jgi:hypothetical protein